MLKLTSLSRADWPRRQSTFIDGGICLPEQITSQLLKYHTIYSVLVLYEGLRDRLTQSLEDGYGAS